MHVKPRVIIRPSAGLTNRLRAIESGLSLAKELKLPVEINWLIDAQMVAKFEDLFVLPKDLFSISYSAKYSYIKSSFFKNPLKRFISKAISKCQGIPISFSEIDVVNLVWTQRINLLEACKNKTSYFYTCQRFFPFHYNYSWVDPVPVIQEKLNVIHLQFQRKKVVGIHIRRSDHEVSINQSPDELFINAIENELIVEPKTIFFLATDSKETEQLFINKYGNEKIVVNKKKFGRESVEATQDSVVDLFALSFCSKLYCSYWSSFSETASILSGVQTIICRKS
jgi:hypothetical protein